MASIRQIKEQARRDLHQHAQVPALYIPATGSEPRLLNVRLHTKFGQIGGLVSDKFWAEREEIKPRVVVMRDEIATPRKGAVFSFAPGEAFRIDHTDPPDNISIMCHVVPLTAAEAQGLPVPNSDCGCGC